MRALLIFFLGVSLLPAQTIQQKGRQVIDEAIAALGGDNFLALKNKVEQGMFFSFYREEISGLSRATVSTMYPPAADPPKVGDLYQRERQSFGKNKESWAVLFSEDDGWEVTYRGAKPLDTETIKNHRDSRQRDIFYILLRRLGEEGLIIEHRGSEVVDNRPMQVVDITDSENRVVRVWFHYSTKLPFRQIIDRRDEFGIRHEIVTIFDKYRDAGGGVMLPLTLQRERDGKREFSMYAESVEINQILPEEIFTLPGNLKILEREK